MGAVKPITQPNVYTFLFKGAFNSLLITSTIKCKFVFLHAQLIDLSVQSRYLAKDPLASSEIQLFTH